MSCSWAPTEAPAGCVPRHRGVRWTLSCGSVRYGVYIYMIDHLPRHNGKRRNATSSCAATPATARPRMGSAGLVRLDSRPRTCTASCADSTFALSALSVDACCSKAAITASAVAPVAAAMPPRPEAIAGPSSRLLATVLVAKGATARITCERCTLFGGQQSGYHSHSGTQVLVGG
eukprot:66068-Chlamydomonas_euryale.AAC.3